MKKLIKNYTTEVPLQKTITEIHHLLAENGATGIATEYDEYLKSLAHYRILLSTPKLDEPYAVFIESARKINDKLMDYKDHMNERINQSDGNRSELAEEFNRKINEVLLKRTDEILWKVEQAKGKSQSISLFQALRRSWSRFKRRI